MKVSIHSSSLLGLRLLRLSKASAAAASTRTVLSWLKYICKMYGHQGQTELVVRRRSQMHFLLKNVFYMFFALFIKLK